MLIIKFSYLSITLKMSNKDINQKLEVSYLFILKPFWLLIQKINDETIKDVKSVVDFFDALKTDIHRIRNKFKTLQNDSRVS